MLSFTYSSCSSHHHQLPSLNIGMTHFSHPPIKQCDSQFQFLRVADCIFHKWPWHYPPPCAVLQWGPILPSRGESVWCAAALRLLCPTEPSRRKASDCSHCLLEAGATSEHETARLCKAQASWQGPEREQVKSRRQRHLKYKWRSHLGRGPPSLNCPWMRPFLFLSSRPLWKREWIYTR